MKIASAIINKDNISFTTLNLIVGSNNTGKSTLLKEAHEAIKNGFVSTNNSKWLDGMRVEVNKLHDEINTIFSINDISQVDSFEPRQAAEAMGFKPFRNNVSQNLRNYSLSSILNLDAYVNNLNVVIDLPKLQSSNQLSHSNEHNVRRFLADIEVLGEFCDSRLSESFSINIQDILQNDSDQSPVRHLRENPELLRKIQDNIQKVFEVRIGFDNLQHGQKPLRILPKEKFSKKADQKSLAIMWRDKSPMVGSQGDGLRAYLKLALSLLDPFSRVIFIDEPETFLHPPQRRALGGLISDMAKQHDKQVFIATHDSEFIRGLLNAGSDVKVLNLKNQNGAHELVELDLRDIKSILNQRGNHLKERAQVLNEAILNSLFYEKTILTENENDRVFYEYYTTLRHNINAQNKRFIGLRGIDEVLSMMQKLNGIGVNVASIVDIDFIISRYAPKYIREAYPDLHSAHVSLREAFNKLPEKIKKTFRKNLKQNGLLAIKDGSQEEQYRDLIDGYGGVGIYIPKLGELESWTGTSKNNLSQMLRIIENRNPRELNKFLKVVLKND